MVAGGGMSGTSKTHLGIFDQVMISNLPNWIYLLPPWLKKRHDGMGY